MDTMTSTEWTQWHQLGGHWHQLSGHYDINWVDTMTSIWWTLTPTGWTQWQWLSGH